MCFVRISEQTATLALYSTNRVVKLIRKIAKSDY